MNDAEHKALLLLGLARRARKLEIGEEPCGIACRSGKGRLLLIAKDAGDHTFRRARSYCRSGKPAYVCLPFTKDELGEWIIRYYKAIWEMYSSSSIFVESKLHLNNNCFISYYFCLYYSLFHAMNALIYLNPNTPIKTVFRVSHHKLKNVFKSEFCNSKSIFDNTTIELFENLKFKREYFSYNAPLFSWLYIL